VRAPRSLQALEQALVDVGLPETLAPEGEWWLQTVGQLRGNIFGVMVPTLFGGRTADELTRVRLWDQHRPGHILGALPTQQWVRQWPPRGQELRAILWPHVEDNSPATHRRWQWTWGGDDRVGKTDGPQWGLVGSWYSGQAHHVRRGIDGLRLGVVIGAGKRVMPVTFSGRRPDPERLALAREPPGATAPLCAAHSHQPHVWAGHGGHRRRARPRALLSALSGNAPPGTPLDPGVDAAALD